jgi:hypothetical protein
MSGLLSMTVIGILAGVQQGGHASASQELGSPVVFTELAEGTQSGMTERTNYLITSSAEFSELWQTLYGTSTPPAVDFSKDSVLALFAGEKPTTGYSIKTEAIRDAEVRTVSVMLTEPGTDCIEGQMVTTPYEIVAVPSTGLSCTHEDIVSTVSCAQ